MTSFSKALMERTVLSASGPAAILNKGSVVAEESPRRHLSSMGAIAWWFLMGSAWKAHMQYPLKGSVLEDVVGFT
jgi:hypothetical protein